MSNSIQRSCCLSVIWLLGLCFYLPGCSDDSASSQALPALEMSTLDGQPWSLIEHAGKVVVFNVWATWCQPCREEMPSLERLSALLDRERFIVVAMSVDSDRLLAQEFVRKYGITFPVLWDKGGRFAEQALGVRAYPETLLISPQGRLMERVSGLQAWDSTVMVEKIKAHLSS